MVFWYNLNLLLKSMVTRPMEIADLIPLPVAITKEAIQDLENCKDPTVLSILEKHFRKITKSSRSVKLKGFQPYSKHVFPIRRIRAGSWRIIYTKYKKGEYLVLKIAARSEVYKDIIKGGLFNKIYDVLQQDHFDLSNYLRKFHKYLPVLRENQEIKVEQSPSLGNAQTHQIILFGPGNNYVISGGAGTGKSICASELSNNYLQECSENGFEGRVLFFTPENLVAYFANSPIIAPLTKEKLLKLTTFRQWQLESFGKREFGDVPEWLELGILNSLSSESNLTPQDLILFQLYVIGEREVSGKELTSQDNKKKIAVLKKIDPATFHQRLAEYLALLNCLRELLLEVKTNSLGNWQTLFDLNQHFISNRRSQPPAYLTRIIYELEKPGKNIRKEFLRHQKILESFKSKHGEFPSRTTYLKLAKDKIAFLNSYAISVKNLLIVVDEAQDLLKEELILVCDHAQKLRTNGINVNVRFFGDLCQRLYPTGYMWEQVRNLGGNIKYLDVNYRNSSEILKITNQLLHLQSKYISSTDTKNFSNIQYKGTFEGPPPRALVVEDFQEAIKFLDYANNKILPSKVENSILKAIAQYLPVLSTSEKPLQGFLYAKFHNLLMLDITRAKGMEFFGNIIFCPFLGKDINSQNFMEWYTIFSRTEERLLIIVTRDEMELMEKHGLSFAGFNKDNNWDNSIVWINEKNQVSVNNLEMNILKKITKEALLNNHFYDDTYEIINEAGLNVNDWENFMVGCLDQLPLATKGALQQIASSASFQCLLKRHEGLYWECCELATSIDNPAERQRIIEAVIDDLHIKYNLAIEAERIRHFYLNSQYEPFEVNVNGFKLTSPGIKGISMDSYLPRELIRLVASKIEEELTAHE